MAIVAPSFYFEKLYPLQDAVLQRISALDSGFYLSGGTASSRGYLQHRFSDDLDLFVNDDSRFTLWASRVIEALAHAPAWTVQVPAMLWPPHPAHPADSAMHHIIQ